MSMLICNLRTYVSDNTNSFTEKMFPIVEIYLRRKAKKIKVVQALQKYTYLQIDKPINHST